MEATGPPLGPAGPVTFAARDRPPHHHRLPRLGSDESQAPLATISESPGALATISEGNCTFQKKEEKEAPEGATNSTEDDKETEDKESGAAEPGHQDEDRASFQEEARVSFQGEACVSFQEEARVSFQDEAPSAFRLTGVALSSEEHTALAEAVAASVAAKLGASIRSLMAPLLAEQERRLIEAMRRPVSELSFGGNKRDSASSQGLSGGGDGFPPPPRLHGSICSSPPASPRLQPRKHQLNPADFSTAPPLGAAGSAIAFTTDPALPSVDAVDADISRLQYSHASQAGATCPHLRAQTMENIGLCRQTSPLPPLKGRGPMPSFDRLVTPCSNGTSGTELPFGKTPSMERRTSLGQRWAKWKNMIGSNARQPNGLQSLEDARANELLSHMAEEQEEKRNTPIQQVAAYDGSQRVSTAGRIPTLPKILSMVPMRVSTCPDVSSGIGDQATPGASSSGVPVYESDKKVKDDEAWLNLPGMNGLKQVLGRKAQEDAGERYTPPYALPPQEVEPEEDRRVESVDGGTIFVVRIDRRGVKMKLGIDVKRDGNVVVITGIHANGLVAAMNKGLSNQVQIGDRILAVNGDSIGILENLSTSQALTLHLQRGQASRSATQQTLADRDGAEEPHGGERHTAGSRSGERRTGERTSSSQGPTRSGRRTKTARSGQEAASVPAGFSAAGLDHRGDEDEVADIFGAAGCEELMRPKRGVSIEDLAKQAAAQANLGSSSFLSPVSRSSSGGSVDLNIFATKSVPIDPKRSGSSCPDKPPDRSSSRRMTGGFAKSEATALRMEREDELLNDLNAVLNEEPFHGDTSMRTHNQVKHANLANERKVRSPLILCLCGILPWESAACCFYQPAMVLLAGGCVVVFAEHLYHAQKTSSVEDGLCDAESCLQFQQVTDLILAGGSLLGMLALRALTCPAAKLLGSSSALLVSYARRQDVVQKWVTAAKWQTLQIFLLWACSMAFRVQMVYPARDQRELTSTILFAFVSILFMGATYGILHVSCAIAIMIDSYCLHLHNDPDSAKGVREWNMLQALLRKASRAVERGFMVLQTTALAVLLLSASSLFVNSAPDFWWLFSNVLLAISVGLNFFKAAEVTEKCTRVPSLVNSLTFNHDMDVERHFLVEYVTYSMAGFYVGEVRLTAAMALKITYVSVLAAFGLLTKLTAAA